uniref:Uncharacterized protein n=1 Tax=Tanacetum cinerariifolium TaxID=118510 RepID=A0A699JTR1_TANCI|nr:hypothetical protein [Tanacetum cinerariifolium]
MPCAFYSQQIEQTMNEQLEAEVLTRSSNSSKTSYVVATDLSEMELKKILINKMEGNKSIHRSNEQRNLYKALTKNPPLDQTGGPRDVEKERSQSQQALHRRKLPGALTGADDQPIVEPSQHPEWFSQQKNPPTPDRDWNKTFPATHGSIQPWISELAKLSDSRSSFDELMDTPVDFSNFLINRLKVDTLTSELLAGPTYKLIKGSCKSLVELEFFLEEVYKATTDQLDWVNPEVMEFLLPGEVPTASEESFYCQKKRDATAHKIALLMKSSSNCQSKSYDSYDKRITLDPNLLHSQSLHQEMDQQNPTLAKIPILDSGKFEQWQFRIQQCLQHEHYALWEVIEFGDSYEVPANAATTGTESDGTSKKKGRHKYKTAQELWVAILETFSGNEATKKNLLKQQYGNFKAEGSETLEQTFNRL